MGRFFNNLKGQIGRDTAKAVSSFVYGDKHATVYRRVDGSNDRNKNQTNQKSNEDVEQEKIDAELSALSGDISHRANQIINQEIPNQEKELSVLLRRLLTQINASSWKSNFSEENVITNKLADAIYFKYQEALFHFGNEFPENRQIDYFTKQLKRLKIKRFLFKNSTVLFIVSFFVALGISVIIFE